LLVPGLKNPIQQAYLMANLKTLKTSSEPQGVVVQLPEQPLDEIDTVVVLKVAGPLDIEKVSSTQAAKGEVLPLPEMANSSTADYNQLSITLKPVQ
jgi:hypothetical protein